MVASQRFRGRPSKLDLDHQLSKGMKLRNNVVQVEPSDERGTLVGIKVRTSWQQELWGAEVASEAEGRATTGVYIDNRGRPDGLYGNLWNLSMVYRSVCKVLEACMMK